MIRKPLLVVVIAMLATVGCLDSSRLDTPPLGLTEESYFSSESEYFLALMNAYAKMTDYYWYHGGAGAILHRLYHLSGDDITESGGGFSAFELFQGISSTNSYTGEFFDRSYELLQRANLIIEKASAADPSEFEDPSFLDYNHGEALFLRALTNFKLYNMYGTAPVVTSRLGSEDLNTPRSEGVQLLDQVIMDCQEAINLLPDSWDSANRGRAFKDSARGLLVKALVFRGNYTGNAQDYTDAYSAYQTISTRALTPSYTDNFDALKENNEESIFEFQASRTPSNDNVWLYNDGPWRGVETMSTYWGFFTTENNSARQNLGGPTWRVTEKVFNAHGTDPRIAFFTDSERSFTKYGHVALDVITMDGARPSSQNNPRILRFADIKLMAAEALLRSGGSKSDAIGLINEVRTRAREWAMAADSIASMSTPPEDYATSETDDATILEWIMNERLIELCGEENKRWWDLKRWDATGDVDLSTWGGDLNGFSTDLAASFQFDYPTHLLWPIPQDEIERNSAITSNNPGY